VRLVNAVECVVEWRSLNSERHFCNDVCCRW